MEEIISKQELEELKKIEGEVRGAALKDDARFILKEKGGEGLKKLEEAMAKFGFPIKYKKLKEMGFYPLKVDVLSVLLIKRLFGFSDKEIQEMGKFEAQSSFVLRLFLKYFASVETIAKKGPGIWKKYYNRGNLKIAELNKEKRYLVLTIEDFDLPSFYYQPLMGYFAGVLQMIVKKPVVCRERKCTDSKIICREFLLEW